MEGARKSLGILLGIRVWKNVAQGKVYGILKKSVNLTAAKVKLDQKDAPVKIVLPLAQQILGDSVCVCV